MKHQAKSIRPFIGSKNFEISRNFYRDLGFEESVISPNMSYFKIFDNLGFYLQNDFVADWINNTMVFVEVADVEKHYEILQALNLPATYQDVKLESVRHESWGSECFLHDPSGILWHFGAFLS